MRPLTEELWKQIREHDPRCDGTFYFGSRATKIFCRPSCTAGKYNPKNIVIFDSPEDALAAGYRPCCRCRPEETEWHGAKAALTDAARSWILSHYTEKFAANEIARALCVTPNYLIRVFKETTGDTLLNFHNRTRCEEAKELLKKRELSISYIANQVGFRTSSHFTVIFKRMTGCTPTEFRQRCPETSLV